MTPPPLYCALCDSPVQAFCSDIGLCLARQQAQNVQDYQAGRTGRGLVWGLLLSLPLWALLVGGLWWIWGPR